MHHRPDYITMVVDKNVDPDGDSVSVYFEEDDPQTLDEVLKLETEFLEERSLNHEIYIYQLIKIVKPIKIKASVEDVNISKPTKSKTKITSEDRI